MDLMMRLGTAPPNEAKKEKGLLDRLAEVRGVEKVRTKKVEAKEEVMTVPPFFYKMVEECGVEKDRVDYVVQTHGMGTVTRFMQIYSGRKNDIKEKELPVNFESLLELHVAMATDIPEPDKASLMLSLVLEHPELGKVSPLKVYEMIKGDYQGLNSRESHELARKTSYAGTLRDLE